jgi:prepilin signal peptidase PulO-like enzyme (type II secretory pathway)
MRGMTRTDYWLIFVLIVCLFVASVVYLPFSVWLTLLSVLLGAVIAGVISWYYNKQAGDELRREAVNLRHYTSVVLRVLEDAGYHVPRDPETGVPLDRVRKDTPPLWRARAKQDAGGDEPRSNR